MDKSLSHSNKKTCNGGNAAAAAARSMYDDLFRGGEAASLSPRAEDYAEIFGGFHASRASAIPVLDLPLVDGTEVFLDARSSVFDYGEVFGGFNGPDFAVSYEELVMMRRRRRTTTTRRSRRTRRKEQSNGRGDSSDEAWSPEDGEHSSEAPDGSVKSQRSSNGVSYEPIDSSTEFNISYHKASQRNSGEIFNGIAHVTQIHGVPGYTFVVDKTTSLAKTDDEYLPQQVGDDGQFRMEYSGEIARGRHLRKTVSNIANRSCDGPLLGDHVRCHRRYTRNASLPVETFVTISDVSLRTQPSQVPPPSRPPPMLDVHIRDSDKACDGISVDGSPPYFDVEIDASSSAAVSAATMKQAMEKAQAKLQSSKEIMERKRDGFQSRAKSGSKNDRKDKEGKMATVDGSSSRKDESGTEFSVLEEGRRFAKTAQPILGSFEGEECINMSKNSAEEKRRRESSSSQGSDIIHGVDEWKEATQFFELVTTNKSTKGFDEMNNGCFVGQSVKSREHGKEYKAAEEALERHAEKHGGVKSLQGHELDEYQTKIEIAEEDSMWQQNSGRSETAKASNQQKGLEKKVQAAHEAPRGYENEMMRMDWQPELGEYKQSRAADLQKHDNMGELRWKESKNEVNQLMKHRVKELQPNVNRGNMPDEKRYTYEKEDNEKRPQEALEKEENEEQLKAVLQQVENDMQEEREKGIKEMHERDEYEMKKKEAYEIEENQRILREALEQEEKDRRLRDAFVKEENERRMEEILEKKEMERRHREAVEQEENEKRQREAREKEENEKRLRESLEKEENEKRMKETLEKEENEKRMKENERRLREAAEWEENKKRQREALDKEEKERRLREACEREENQKRLEALEKKENGKEQKDDAGGGIEKICHDGFAGENEKKIKLAGQTGEAHNHEEYMGTLREAQQGEQNETGLKEARQTKDIRDASPDSCEWEETRIKPKHAGESGEPEGVNKKRMHCTLLNQAYKLDDDKNLGANQLNSKILEANEEIAHEDIGKTPTVQQSNVKDATNETVNLIVDDKIEVLGRAQGDTIHERGQSVNEGATDSSFADEGVEKAGEAGNGIGDNNYEKIKPPSQVVGNQEKEPALDMRETGKNIKHTRVVLDCGDCNDSFVPASVKESVDSGRKMEAAHPEMKRNTQRIVHQVNGSQISRRILLNETLSSEEETERMRKEKELEMERLKKIEEEREREREREKDRMAVDRATLESRERAYTEVRERAERAAIDRVTAETRHRVMTEARERLEKACAEAREKSLNDKTSMEARLRAERAAVERATTEARERAFEKVMAERAGHETRVRVDRSVSDKFSSSSRNSGMRSSSSSSDLQDLQSQNAGSYGSSRFNGSYYTERFEGAEGESAQRCRARLERHRRTTERVAKALAEKNMRDLVAQREQVERNRLAETLDADVKRWSNGKEGNLRALLSTLQYILGPDSGWQPIPLTEVITASAVKKAYRKATLCVHPDKLQQRGASIQQKYVCEKVFDLLKEAWNKFNSEER